MNTAKNLDDLRKELIFLYRTFFEELKIEYNKKSNTEELTGTGLWKGPKGENLRFATMPHIGKNYAEAKTKILFVGYDIGKDEFCKENRMQTFDERQFTETDFNSINPHIAGTYAQALFLLQNSFVDQWNAIKNSKSPNITALKNASKSVLMPKDLLSFVAQTNLYKFVTVCRGEPLESGDKNGRRGEYDRDWFGKREAIEKLLVDEVKILKPDIICFQGLNTINDSIWEKLIKTCDWEMIKYHSYHPADFSNGRNTPKYISELIGKKVK